MTMERAMEEFLLYEEDLEGLPRTVRRSPYRDGPAQIVVLKRIDVVERAHTVWDSRGRLIFYDQNQRIHDIRRRRPPRDTRRLLDAMHERIGLFSSSGLVVIGALCVNMINLLFKVIAWYITGSLSIFAEALHSIGDTINQLIVSVCMHLSYKTPTVDHPYGYTNLKSVSAVVAGTVILVGGAGISVYEGVHGLMHPKMPEHIFWGIGVLVFSGVTETVSLIVAVRDIVKKARRRKMTVFQYVLRSQEPSVNVVLLEDTVAVISVFVILSCLGLCISLQSGRPDAVGSIVAGALLGIISIHLIYANATFLLGRHLPQAPASGLLSKRVGTESQRRSIPSEKLERINAELEADVMVRAIHDVKGIDMGNFKVRYKAELDFDGRVLTRAYLDRFDMNHLLNQVRDIKNVDDLEEFMLGHGEALVDMIGGEIDRIEQKLKKADPDIRHCDLEIL